MSYSQRDYEHMGQRREAAFSAIARKLGKDHAITKMMGTLSYGRHHAEIGPDSNLRKEIERFAFLNGYFDCLNHWARDHDPKAQRIMLDLWPGSYSKAP